MRILLLSLFILPYFAFSQNQAKITEVFVDSLSYSQFLKGERKALDASVKMAEKEKIDFYYLRIRAGILNYNDKRYMAALGHFEKALAFYPADTLTQEYLFYTLIHLGKNQEALKLYNGFYYDMRKKLEKDLPTFHAIVLEGGYMSSNASDQYTEKDMIEKPKLYGEIDATGDLWNTHAGIKTPLGEKTSLYVGLSYLNLNKKKEYYWLDMSGVRDTSDEYTYSQIEYYMGLQQKIGKHWEAHFGFHYINYSTASLYSYRDTVFAMFRFYNAAYKDNNWILNAGISGEIGKYLRPQIDLGYSHMGYAIIQPSAALNYYPFGNLNVYGSTGFAISNDSSETRSIFVQKIGLRLNKRIWAEASAHVGNLKNYQEGNAFVVYNVADKISAKYGISLTGYICRNFELSVRYDYIQREGSYTNETKPGNFVKSAYSYQNNSFTGSLALKF
jgi:hypothetical protein